MAERIPALGWANAFSPVEYQPDITGYDYGAPINEQGQPYIAILHAS